MLLEIFRWIAQLIRDCRDNILELFFWDVQNFSYGNPENIPEGVQNPILASGCNDCTDLYWFIRCNAPIFTVIGIIGTMLSLIPNFLDKFSGPDWKLSFLSSTNGFFELIFIQILVDSGCFLIIFISILIMSRLFFCNFSNFSYHSILGLKITKGRLHKWLFVLVFVPFILSFIYFLIPISSITSDPYFQSVNTIVLGTYVIFILFFVAFLLSVIPRVNPIYKTFLLLIIVTVFLYTLFFIVNSVYFALISNIEYNENIDYGSVQIEPVYLNYSFITLGSYGLPLKVGGPARNITNFDYRYLKFHWTTNYGYFLDVPTSNDIITNEGQDCRLSDGSSTVFWTYELSDHGVRKPPVQIFLRIENTRTNKVLSRDGINLSWSDLDNVTVKNTGS